MEPSKQETTQQPTQADLPPSMASGEIGSVAQLPAGEVTAAGRQTPGGVNPSAAAYVALPDEPAPAAAQVHAVMKSAGEKWLVPVATILGALVTISTIIGQLPGVSSLGFVYNSIAPFLYVGRGVLVPLLALLGAGALVWGIRGRKQRRNSVWRFSAGLMVLLLMVTIMVIRPSERVVGVLPYAATADSKVDVPTGQALADYLRGTLNKPGGLIKAIGVPRIPGESLSDAGKRVGAEIVVEGSYTLGKGGVEVRSTLYDVASGEMLGNPQTRDVLAENLQSSQQEVAQALAGQIDIASAVTNKAYAAADLNCSTAYECYVVGRRYYLWFNEEGYKRAISYYGVALGFDPNYARAYAGLAEANLLLSGLSRYRGKIQDANKLSDMAADEASRAVDKGPGLVESHRARAWVYSTQGLRRNARSEYDLIARLSPPSPEMVLTATGVLTSVHPSGDAESLWLLGSDTFDANTKIALFSEALRLKPDLAQVRYDLGAVQYSQGRLDDAEASFRKALSINPNMIYAHVGLGQLDLTRALMQQGQTGSADVITGTSSSPTGSANYLVEARRQVDIALEQLPDYGTAIYVKGAILAAQGALQPAIKTTRQALEGSRDVGVWYAYQFYDDPVMYSTSIQSLKQAIQALPEYVYNYNALGNFYMAEGHIYEAQHVYSQAVTLDPSFGSAWNNLSVTQSYFGQYDAAVISARHAVTETKDWSAPYYQLGKSVLALAESKRPDLITARANPPGASGASSQAGLPTPVANPQPAPGCPQITTLDQADVAADLSSAEATLRKALEINPRDTLAHAGLGQALFDEGLLARLTGREQDAKPRFEEARTELEGAAKGVNEFDDQTHYLLGLVYLNEQRHDQVAGELEKAFLIDPSNDSIIKTYADFMSATDKEGASSLYTRRVSLYAGILADHPRSPFYHRQMAGLLQSAGQSDGALAEYNTALQLDPTSPDLRNALGNYYFSYSEYGKALQAYMEASRLAPSEPVYRLNIGGAAKGLAQQEENQENKQGAAQHYSLALSNYSSAEELDPAGDYHTFVGDVYLAQKKYDEAAKEYKQVTRDRSTAMYELAGVYKTQGDYTRATDTYKEAICAASTTVAMVLSYGALADLHVDQGNYTQAVDVLTTALRIAPNNASLHNKLGFIYWANLHNPDGAITEFKLAVKFAPELAFYHYGLASAFFTQQRYEEAAPEFKAALDVAPTTDTYRWSYAYYLGRSYTTLKRTGDAQKALEMAVKLDPTQADAHAWLAVVYHNASDPRACDEMKKAHTIALASADPQVQANDKDYLAAVGQWGCP
ncbi:MAG: tetratricopeptide repeat protein [Chloroflexota bacterium]|nr:tetratricopeptide repeat protein [Chloroflexota bacterium]